MSEKFQFKQNDFPEMNFLSTAEVIARSDAAILGVYKRFPVVFTSGRGSRLFDIESKEYLDFAGGIAVTSLGHAHPEINKTLRDQSGLVCHTSNLFHNLPQIELAEKLKQLTGPGKLFFANSGAEANECMIKLARAYGSKLAEINGTPHRYEIISMRNSFHGRTLATIAATGQDKVKIGFEPIPAGFLHADFNDLSSIENAITEKTVAVIIEGIQGEGGIIIAEREFLIGLRALCNKYNLLLLFDSVQCGFFRTGSFQSYTEILKCDEKTNSDLFLPDAISMAKSLGGGFPISACWISDSLTQYLGAGSHGTTYGGNPLACKIASKIIEIVERDRLDYNARMRGVELHSGFINIKNNFPNKLKDVRGMGLIQGVEFHPFTPPSTYESLTPAAYICLLGLQNGLLLVPAGNQTVRALPQLGVTIDEINEGLERFRRIIDLVPDSCFQI
ncbi:MAG TPA: acetylornithine transaminase [Oligoflexia bacterium]|nr:acetylornithine transaminase [Oligoflexia bacterium]HMP48726.1 acetylornithine transaminase [Oligoflexia bacterium]